MTIKKMKRKAAYPTYQLFFIATLFLFGYIIWNTLGYLLVPFLWSIILYVIFQKFYNKLIEEKKQELLKNAKIEINQKQLEELKLKYQN